MSNLNKDALIQLENTASYQPISDLNVTFRTADNDSAVFYFNVTKYDKPLLLSNENVKARIAIRKQGVLVIAPIEIEDPFNGLLKYQLPNDVLSRDGKYQAQVLVSEVGESEVAVAERLFTFNVEKSLFSGIDAETKLSYIVEFQDLEKLIMDRVTAIDEALANGEDYVTQVENARTKGLSDIQIALTDALSKIQAQETSSLKVITDKGTEYSTKFDADKQYIDTQSAAFKESVKGSGLVTTGASASWQKYKLTNDDGTRALVSIGNDVEKLRGLTPGFYYCTTVPITGASSTAGFVTMEMRDSGLKRITFRPYNSNQQFIMRYYNTWGEWELVGLDPANVETVTNSQAKANVAEGNAKAYADSKYNNRNTIIFEGTANGVGSVINLSETLDNFILLYFYGTFPGGLLSEVGNPMGTSKISLTPINLVDSDGNGGGIYEIGLTKTSRTALTITTDVFFDIGQQIGSGANANKCTITRIVGVRK
ncbi:BppU family phage baseplate upper protein [Staphylococcus xylosus]|uniref:BppU family phage baseplate upper protein n=1 Tax=Staphylococcus xylosus TaxID=1288 RepID=UPI002DB6DFE1|nr:BppU family phage baseplate upper protein [Staphylococcus xylosus]MEB8101063.1 BppU family phage baseplate upper protein [Staphylococcus xylosus]